MMGVFKKGLILGWALSALPASGEEVVSTENQAYLAGRLYEELFDTPLPGQYQEGEWSLSLQPKLGDFLDDDYVRFLAGLRYNFSNYFDAYADLGSYFMNPLGGGTGAGLYALRFGARYTWFNFPAENNNIAFGVRAEVPFSNPPIEVTDSYARYEPYITISHHLRGHPNWMLYFNASYQLVNKAPTHDQPLSPQPRDRLFLRPGVIFYSGGHFRYSLELEYRTNAFHFRGKNPPPTTYKGPPEGVLRPGNWILAYEEVHELIALPGLTWFPSRKIRDGLWIPGNWDLGIRVEIPLIDETGQDFGISLRFRWFYDYRKFLREDLSKIINARYPSNP